jgi:hypothetical protein
VHIYSIHEQLANKEDSILILYQVFNFAVLVCIVAETTLCSHDKLTINIFLGCHIAKFVYIGVFLVQIIWGFNFNFKKVIEFVDFIAPLIFALYAKRVSSIRKHANTDTADPLSLA